MSGQNGQSALLTWAEAERRTGKSRRTLKRLAAAGKLSVDRSGEKPLVPVDELLRLGLLDRVGAEVGTVGTPTGTTGTEVGKTGTEAGTPMGTVGTAQEEAEPLPHSPETELAVAIAERDRLRDEVRWLRERVERLEGTIGQLALPEAATAGSQKPEVRSQESGVRSQETARSRATASARFWAWFWGRER